MVQPRSDVNDPVSTLVTREVPAPLVATFEAHLHDIITAACTFPGHLGVDVLRPDGGGRYQILFRFRDRAAQAAWMDSTVRHDLVAKADAALADPANAQTRSVDGWEGWFVTPGYAPPTPPRRWKMAVLTLCGLYPIVLALGYLLAPVTQGWPRPVGLLLSLAVTTSVMTWLVMPNLTHAVGRWLRH